MISSSFLQSLQNVIRAFERRAFLYALKKEHFNLRTECVIFK